MEDKNKTEKKTQAQQELDAYRESGVAYLSEADKKLSFENVDDPEGNKNEDA